MIARMLGAAMLAAALPLAAGHAAPLSGGEIQARTAGGEFRGYGATRRAALEDVIWRFRPDGTVASLSQLRRRAGPSSGYTEEYRDSGTWRIEGVRLCVEFRSVHRDFSGCYAVDGGTGDHVRLGGPVHLEGTLGR